MRQNLIAAVCGFIISAGLGLAVSASATSPCVPTTTLVLEYSSYTIDGEQRRPLDEHPPLDTLSVSAFGIEAVRTEVDGTRSFYLEEAGE